MDNLDYEFQKHILPDSLENTLGILSFVPIEILAYIFQFVLLDLDYKFQLVPYLLVSREFGTIFREEYEIGKKRSMYTLKGIRLFNRDQSLDIEKCDKNKYISGLFKLHQDYKKDCRFGFYLSLCDKTTLSPEAKLLKSISRNTPFVDLERAYYKYRADNPEYFSTLMECKSCALNRMRKELATYYDLYYTIKDWDLMVWEKDYIIIQYFITSIYPISIACYYKKQCGFTFKDILERQFCFYSSVLTRSEVQVVERQIDKQYKKYSHHACIRLLIFPLEKLIGKNNSTSYPYSFKYKGVVKEISLCNPSLATFFCLSTCEQLFILAFTKSLDDILNPVGFRDRFLQRVDKGLIKKGNLLLKPDFKRLNLSNSKHGPVWFIKDDPCS